MVSAFFYFQPTLSRLSYRVMLILDKFSLNKLAEVNIKNVQMNE